MTFQGLEKRCVGCAPHAFPNGFGGHVDLLLTGFKQKTENFLEQKLMSLRLSPKA
jgi:hypothetical protein